MVHKFTKENLQDLWRPREDSNGEDNGQLTIIGGSDLFTGAPLMSLVAATRIVDMVFLATPKGDKNIIHKETLFSRLRSVIWIPREDLDAYVAKSDAILIGPGLKRYHREGGMGLHGVYDGDGTETKMLTKYLLQKFPDRQWVIDGGSLQTMEADWIPEGSILTPNNKEFEILFGTECSVEAVKVMAEKYKCIIVGKGAVAYVSDGQVTYEVEGGNPGLTKGGTGDVLAGLIAGLVAKNSPLLAAAAGAWLVKKTAERLYERVGLGFNADDVAENVFETWHLNFSA